MSHRVGIGRNLQVITAFGIWVGVSSGEAAEVRGVALGSPGDRNAAASSPHLRPAPVPVLANFEVSPNPNSRLSAIAEVELDRPGRVVIELESEGHGRFRTLQTENALTHRIEVLGMRSEREYRLQAVARYSGGGVARSSEVSFLTGELPSGIPSLEAWSAGDQEPAITILGPSTRAGNEPYFIGVDREGEVVWYYDPADLRNRPTRSAELLEDGSLQLLISSGVRVISPGGETEREVEGNPNEVRFYHDAVMLPNGNVVGLDAQVESYYADYFGAVVDVKGDVLTEINRDGEVVWEWHLLDHLDRQRFPGDLSVRQDRNGAYDWSHSNSITYDAQEDALIVSVRHQSWVIAVSRSSGELLWTLGEGGDFELEGGEWMASQHAAGKPARDVVLLYDNGNDKNAGTSRGVAYRTNSVDGTATELWSWDTGIMTSNYGDVDYLPSGNLLICAGGTHGDPEDGHVSEVSLNGELLWELRVGDGMTFYRATRVQWLERMD